MGLLPIALLGWLAYELVLHTLRWSVKSAYLAFGPMLRDLSRIHVSNHADPAYYTTLAVGAGISLLTFVLLMALSGYGKLAWVWLCQRTRHR